MGVKTDHHSGLDPSDWPVFRKIAHEMLDDIIDHVQSIRNGPVWRPAPPEVKGQFTGGLPKKPTELNDVLGIVRSAVLPYATGNLHPRFMGWFHGAGTAYGIVAEMIAAGLNMNCGGRNHIGIDIELQIVLWLAEALGYPPDASGLFLTGSSMANFLAVTIARVNALGMECRSAGLDGKTRLVAYASHEAHGCIAQAMELAGIGSANLRRIQTDERARISVEDLARAVRQDKDEGLLPFIIVATAGTTNTGAIDPIQEVADVAKSNGIWLHIDGAIGAALAFVPQMRHKLDGIAQSDSIAFDFHKWSHVPFDAGFLLVRDPEAHRKTFVSDAAYLQRAERGVAAGKVWPCDLGPDLSRGFRALKTWMTIQTLGTEQIGEAILENCRLASFLGEKISQSPYFTLRAPVALNIVCFALRDQYAAAIQSEIVMDLQETGIAVLSQTLYRGEPAIRCAIVNHRTTLSDVELVFTELTACAQRHIKRSSGFGSELPKD